MHAERHIHGVANGNFLIDAGDVGDPLDHRRAEIVIPAENDRPLRKQAIAIADGEIEGGIVGDHHHIGLVIGVLDRHRLGQRFDLGAVAEAAAVEILDRKLDLPVGSDKALAKAVLDAVAPRIAAMVGIDEQDARFRRIRRLRANAGHSREKDENGSARTQDGGKS